LIARLNQYVHDVHAKLYPEYFKKYEYDAIKDFFKGIINNPNFIFLLLEDEGQHLGYAWVKIREYPENAFKKSYQTLYVHQISIAEPFRKKGCGSKLLEAIYDIAKTNNISKIELDYWVNNDMAKNFYKKRGFVKYREFVYKEIDEI
jgi:diamine N-acetyltransferase